MKDEELEEEERLLAVRALRTRGPESGGNLAPNVHLFHHTSFIEVRQPQPPQPTNQPTTLRIEYTFPIL